MLEFKKMNLNSSTKTENTNGEQSNEVTKNQCSFCEKTFYNAYYLDMHINGKKEKGERRRERERWGGYERERDRWGS